MAAMARQRVRERARAAECSARNAELRAGPRCTRCGILQAALPADFQGWRGGCVFIVLDQAAVKALAVAEARGTRGNRPRSAGFARGTGILQCCDTL
jgi:hypothetical protein